MQLLNEITQMIIFRHCVQYTHTHIKLAINKTIETLQSTAFLNAFLHVQLDHLALEFGRLLFV